MSTSKHVVVFITTPPGPSGHRLANFLVRKKLAACVNVIPRVRSVYWWKGKVEKALESLLVVKTQGRHVKQLTSQVRKVHPYTVPEIISMPITAGHQDYLRWVTESTRNPL